MVRQLPSSGSVSGNGPGGCNTTDMIVIHNVYRAGLAEAPAIVRGVRAGDVRHAAAVAAYLGDFTTGLHNHHAAEDTLLWDELAARAPSCADHVGQMRDQHAAVSDLLDVVDALIPEWTESADPALRDRLAVAVDNVRDTLLAHLGQEEQDILPVAGAAFSQREWDALGEHARAGIPRDRMFIQLGYMLHPMSKQERSEWSRKNLPLVARVMYRLVGRRQFEAERRRVLQQP